MNMNCYNDNQPMQIYGIDILSNEIIILYTCPRCHNAVTTSRTFVPGGVSVSVSSLIEIKRNGF
jgi:hypothetical protein